MTTPTKAAMRAAHAVAKAYGSAGGNYTRDAELIDREFAELVACLREARKLDALGSKEANAEWRNFRTEKYGCEILRIHARIDAALASIGDDE